MHNINRAKFDVLINKWRNPKNTADVNKLKLLAEETIKAVESEPFIKDVCNIFLYSISAKAINDPTFNAMQIGELRDAKGK